MNKYSFAVAIPLYNPDKSSFDNLSELCLNNPQINFIFYRNSLFDNSLLPACPNIFIIGNGTNDGLPIAYNNSIKFINSQLKNKYIFILDQDSQLSSSYFTVLEQILAQSPSPCYAYCPYIFDMGKGQYRTSKPLTHLSSFQRPPNLSKPTSLTINSGMVLPVQFLVDSNLYFDEKLFIDLVDVFASVHLFAAIFP